MTQYRPPLQKCTGGLDFLCAFESSRFATEGSSVNFGSKGIASAKRKEVCEGNVLYLSISFARHQRAPDISLMFFRKNVSFPGSIEDKNFGAGERNPQCHILVRQRFAPSFPVEVKRRFSTDRALPVPTPKPVPTTAGNGLAASAPLRLLCCRSTAEATPRPELQWRPRENLRRATEEETGP